MRKLLIQENFSWNFHNSDLYRRRIFSKQFLQNEASPYPCYVFQSPLSKAFDKDFQIEAEIDLSEFNPKLLSIQLEEKLVTSTNEFIKNIQKKVYYERNGTKIFAKANCNLILQTAGCREYFVGNYQLLQYERVRLCLRKKTKMKLILTQIPKNYRAKFPPLYKHNNIKSKPTKNISMGDSSYDLRDDYLMQSGDMGQIFQDSLESSPYFWYSPVPNLNLHLAKQISQALQGGIQSKMATPSTKRKSSADTSVNVSQQIQSSKHYVRINQEKQPVSLTDQRSRMRGTTIPKSDETVVLMSGECSFQFQFKLQALERINVLFNEMQEQVATKYESTMPKNVTFREDAVVVTHEQATTYEQMKNFILNKKNETKKKKSVHKLVKKATTLFNDKANNPLKKLSLSNLQQSKSKKHDELTLYQRLLDNTKPKSKKPKENPEATEFKRNKKLEKGHGHGHEDPKDKEKKEEYLKLKAKYIRENIQRIQTSFCSFSDNMDPIYGYQNLLKCKFGKLTPVKLRVECTLYHGCEELADPFKSQEVCFNSNVSFNQLITFKNLKYCQIPVKTRLSFNIVLIFKQSAQLTIGCVSINLFDEKGMFRSGVSDLNVWPFYEIDERLGCMKEYDGMKQSFARDQDLQRKIHLLFTKLVIEFESFICPMMYSSRDGKKLEKLKLTSTEEDEDDEKMLKEESISNELLARLKSYFNPECTPLDNFDDEKKTELFKCREHYQTHPRGLPIFLKSVKWDRPVQVNVVYNMLENWAPMKPEDAIQLLDAKFPDERVRKYAVQRISLLSDDELALYMLQFSQALLYEEYHWSPLSEMLIQRSLANPYVVGQAFFWGLRSNLYLKASYERYYVLLEQFLMLCGTYINEIWIQFQVNRELQKVSLNVAKNRLSKMDHGDVEKEAKVDLRTARKNLPFLFTTVCDSKYILKDFAYDKFKIFSSAKAPLFVRCINNMAGQPVYQTIFKNGDDLRQDILTLQILAIMDRIWLENQLDLAMSVYKVIGTDLEQGFLEVNTNCTNLADIQVMGGISNTFSDNTIDLFFREKITKEIKDANNNISLSELSEKLSQKLEKIRDVFIRSTAGYCVASYVLGLGDRHPDNIMINEKEGNFLHIDFGHFLQNYKCFRLKKYPALPGIPREVDPFVFTPEIAYFVNGQSFRKVDKSNEDKESKAEKKLAKPNQDKRIDEEIEFDEEMNILQNDAELDKLHAAAGSQDEGVAEELKTKNFKKFEMNCCKAFEILRQNGDQLVTLFQIMLSAGMPELNHDTNIKKLVDRLHLGMTEREASKHFKIQIQKAMTTLTRRIDNLSHNIKHKSKSKKKDPPKK